MVYSYNRIFLRNQNDQNIGICNNMNDSESNYAKERINAKELFYKNSNLSLIEEIQSVVIWIAREYEITFVLYDYQFYSCLDSVDNFMCT